MNTRLITSVFFTCLLWLGAMCAYADEPIEQGHQRPVASIDNLDQPVDLAPYIEYIEDPDRTITFEDIQAGRVEQRWRLNTAPTFVGKNYNSRYWFRINLNYLPQDANLKPVVYIPTHPNILFELTVWIPDGNSNYRKVSTGGLQSYYQRDIPSLRYGFRLPTNNATHTLVGWADNRSASSVVLLPMMLMSSDQFVAEQSQVYAVMIAIYAMMAALLLYNTCLFVSLKQPLYGYYLLFLSAAIYTCANNDGITDRWLWPTLPLLDTRLGAVVCSLLFLFYLLFVWEALDHIQFSARCRKSFQIMFGLGGLLLLHNGITPFWEDSALVIRFYSSLMIILVLITLILAVQKRLQTACYLLVAELFALMGGTTFMLMTQGILPINNITLWSLHGGFLVEALLLSLSLAARTRLIQQAAIDNLKKYETIYNNSIEGMFQYSIKDDSGKCNPSMATLFGYQSMEAFMTDNRFTRLSDETTNKRLGKLLATEGKVTDFETQITHQQTQQPVWLSVNMWLTKNNQGQPDTVEGTVADITDKKLKELAQREALENLTRSDELKNEFLATMSHELRTPMNGISGYLELLKSLENNGDAVALLNSLEHCSADMLRLIDRILDFTQLLAGNLSIESNLLDITLLLDELENLYRQRCNAKALTFTLTKDESLPVKVWGDKKKLFVIINDLLDNAVKYTRSGGVEVIIKSLPTKSELGNPYDVMYSLLISVRDNGIGIAMADRPKIFKAFSQIDRAFNRKYSGLGLGLAMCQEYIKLMNGTLTLLSEPGKGSKFDFIVDLKVVPNLTSLNATVDKNPEPYGKCANILIVEDNPTNQIVLNGMLKKLGHTTSIAENGIRALEILANTEFDLILMDCQMPEMDGFEATRAIRNGNSLKDIPIIAVTANVMEGAAPAHPCARGISSSMNKMSNAAWMQA